MSSSEEAPTAELVLAAIDRAVVQSVRPVSDVSGGAIADHLALSRKSGAWRIARRHLLTLVVEGAVRQGKRNGVVVWGLTSSGRRRLARSVRPGERPELPESPQHRLWSDSRRLADQEIDRIRHELAGALGDGTRLLREAAVPAATWLELAQRLSCAAERLGAVVYCVADWPEPGEDGPDPSRGPRLRRLARFGKQP
jgi:hypothetical protein